jgi:hypothetical protein
MDLSAALRECEHHWRPIASDRLPPEAYAGRRCERCGLHEARYVSCLGSIDTVTELTGSDETLESELPPAIAEIAAPYPLPAVDGVSWN